MAFDYGDRCIHWPSAYRDEAQFDRCILEDDQDEVSGLLLGVRIMY